MSESGSPMRSRPLKQRNIFGNKGRFGPNMTPMVDVVLVILIFFMAATTIVGQEWFLKADLPEQREETSETNGFTLPTPMLDLELFVERDRVVARGLGPEAIGIDKVIERSQQIKRGNPLDTDTMVGAQASQEQFDKILTYIDIGKKEGAKVLIGGGVEQTESEFNNGYYIQPTLLEGHNKMRVFQEEIFGPVISVSKFKDEAEALELANQSEFGLGAGVWTRDMNKAFRMGRGIQAGRVWTNCYHMYPAHAAFGGYKKSGVGRETHKMALEHYQQTKNLLVSYDINPLGFF